MYVHLYSQYLFKHCGIYIYSFKRGCSNAIINAETSNSLRIKSVQFADHTARDATINGPQGHNTSLHLYAHFSQDSFTRAIIYADNTTKIEMYGTGIRKFKNVILYALYSESILIQCNGIHTHSGCENLKIYLYSDSFDISSPYPHNRLTIKCESSTDCIGMQLFIVYNNDYQWNCSFVFNNSLWYCGNHLITINSQSPSYGPTNEPIASPTYIPSTSPYNPTILPPEILPSSTDSPSFNPTRTPVNTLNDSIITPNSFKLAIITGSLIIGCCCSIICFIVSIALFKAKFSIFDGLGLRSKQPSINSNDLTSNNNNIQRSLALPSRAQNITSYDH